jgi:glycosyltransferase involved in cell wall biosynthesis
MKTMVAVVIPAYKVSKHILGVVGSIGRDVSHIIVVDDACPEGSGDIVIKHLRDKRVVVIKNPTNLGVGGATKAGYMKALELNADIIVKMDGDGQMDPTDLDDLIKPLVHEEAAYTKGNRFYNIDGIQAMPKVRILGNLILSFFSKFSSGYWNIFDPTNGFTAISNKMLKNLQLDKIDNRYFFESDMLFRLYLSGAKVVDVPMNPRYLNEVSSLKITNSIFEFSLKHARNFLKRIFYVYYVRDFTLASIELPLGIGLGAWGSYVGLSSWIHSAQLGISTETGIQIFVAISMLASIQFILSFMDFDVRNYPK